MSCLVASLKVQIADSEKVESGGAPGAARGEGEFQSCWRGNKRNCSLGLTFAKGTALGDCEVREFRRVKERSFTPMNPGPSWGYSSNFSLRRRKVEETRGSAQDQSILTITPHAERKLTVAMTFSGPVELVVIDTSRRLLGI